MKSVQLDMLDGRRKRRNPVAVPTEAQEQTALIAWARLAEGKYPELSLLHHIPNGGHRYKAVAVAMQRQGVRRGVPDLCLPVARGGAHGLYIEMKRTRGGSVLPEQAQWASLLREQGYRVELCKGWEQARDVIISYLDA